MSLMVNGPIGMPNLVTTASICCGSAPSYSSLSDCLPRAASMRLPTKPSQLPTTAGILAMRREMATAVTSTSGAVLAPRTISHSFITLAGLKKCMPSTSCGRLVDEAISSMLRYEVLLARIAPGLAIASSLPKTSFLIAMVSNTASMMRSASLAASRPTLPVIRPIRFVTSSGFMPPRAAVAS